MFGRGRLSGAAAGVATLALLTAAPAGAQDAVRPLLPDLRAQPQKDLTFSTVGIFGGATVDGCFADEIVEDGARRCLRFDQSIANLGEGPFELRYAPPDYATDPFMYQRIYRSDGSWEDRRAEQYEFHATHAHFHYRGFGQSRLWRTDASGARVGDAPLRVGRKNGFCVMDIDKMRPDAPPRRYDGGGCTATSEWVNGITQGWADTYTADLPDQYIEVSGVEDGVYQLETLADPDGTVVERDETNNSVFIRIRIKGNSVQHLGKVNEAPPAGPPPPPPSSGQAQGGGSTESAPRRRTAKRKCKSQRKRGSSGAKKKQRRCRRGRRR